MNTIQPSSPRRMKQSKPTSHVRPDEFLPIRTTAEGSPRRSIGSGKQRSTSLLDSLRMKLEHEKSGDSDKILNGIRTRLETTPNHKSSAAGEQQQQQQQQQQCETASITNQQSSTYSEEHNNLASSRSNNSIGRAKAARDALRPQDFMRAQDVDRTPGSTRKAIPGGFVPYTSPRRSSNRSLGSKRCDNDDDLPLSALASRREQVTAPSTPVKPRRFTSPRKSRRPSVQDEEELDLDELKSHRTAKTEPMNESESSMTMSSQFSITGSSVAFGNNSDSVTAFNNSGISGLGDSFSTAADSELCLSPQRAATNTTPKRNQRNSSTKLASVLASPNSSSCSKSSKEASQTSTPQKTGSSTPRSKSVATIVANLAPPPLSQKHDEDYDDDGQTESTMDSTLQSKSVESQTSSTAERSQGGTSSSKDSSSSTQPRRSRSLKKKKSKSSNKPRTLKVSKKEFKKLNAFLATQQAEREDSNTAETDEAKVESQDSTSGVRRAASAVSAASLAAASSSITPRSRSLSRGKKTVRRVPVSKTDGSVASEMRDDAEEDQCQSSSTKQPAWAARRLKATAQGEKLKRGSTNLAKPISAARPPVIGNEDDDDDRMASLGEHLGFPNQLTNPRRSKVFDIVDDEDDDPFRNFDDLDDDNASLFSRPSFTPSYSGRKVN